MIAYVLRPKRFASSVLLLLLAACPGGSGEELTGPAALRARLDELGVRALAPPPAQRAEMVALGRALMFDPILSGNKDVSCATCHLPAFGTGDGLPLSIGTGGTGIGAERVLGEGRLLVPRNATDLFLRGDPGWTTFFRDLRIAGSFGFGVDSPTRAYLPPELDQLLALQAMMPVTSRDEMRGELGDLTVLGEPNELAVHPERDLNAIWDGVYARLMAIPAYVTLFEAAFPGEPVTALGFEHGAMALAAFQIHSWSPLDSPWDRFLAGEDEALSPQALGGALLFYGEAGCARCHAGPLLSDQQAHNIGAPQLGPGKEGYEPLDVGREHATGKREHRFQFRSPPLRNVALTGPYFHNGAYRSLEAAVRHHLDARAALRNYDPAVHLPEAFRDTVHDDEETLAALLEELDPLMLDPPSLTDDQVALLLDFLEALTSPTARAGGPVIPEQVPSGLPLGL